MSHLIISDLDPVDEKFYVVDESGVAYFSSFWYEDCEEYVRDVEEGDWGL